MLQKLSRVFLIVLLLAALPAQGLAAVSMGICRAFHDGQESGMAAAAGHAHGTHEAHAGDHGTPPGAQPDTDGSVDAQSAHCGACTACGAAAGISPSMTIESVARAADRVRPELDHSRAGITPAGLERPPLPLPA